MILRCASSTVVHDIKYWTLDNKTHVVYVQSGVIYYNRIMGFVDNLS